MLHLRRVWTWIQTHPLTLLMLLVGVVSRLTAWHLPAGLLVAPILLDDVNTVTTKTIMPGVVDNFFKAGPLIAYLKSRFTRRWIGPQIQENYMYAAMKGGAYKKGATFNILKRQTRTGMLFTPRYYEVNVTEFLEDIEVEMVGPQAMFNVVKTDLAEAALTMSAILEIAAYHHGQALAANDRSAEMNGLEEALTNGTDGTWSGDGPFTSYGGQLRTSVAPALNSPTGLVAANTTGTSFRALQHSYLSTVIGNEHPVLGVTTNREMGFISETFLPHQIIDVVDPEINWPGIKFNQAKIVVSQYAPGQDGVNDGDLGNYNASGETFWWLNPGPQGEDAYLRLYIAQSPKFAFGFTGFKGARDDNMVAGQILFGGNFTVRAPRLQRALYGLTK